MEPVGVVVGEEPAGIGSRPVGLHGLDLLRGQRYQLDVGEPRLLALNRRRVIPRPEAGGHVAEGRLLVGAATSQNSSST